MRRVRRPAQGLVRLIDRGQQFDVGPRIALRETPPPIHRRPHPPAGGVTRDQARNLRPAQSRHLLDVTSQQTSCGFALPGVLLLNQHLLDPAVKLMAVFALKPDFLAGLTNRPIASKLNFSASCTRMFTSQHD